MPAVTFADSVQPSFGIPWRPPLTREQVKDWDNERLAHYLKVRKDVEAGAIENPVGKGWSLPMWDLVQENWSKYKNIIILGGNRCMRGDSMVFDPVLGIHRRIDSIDGPHHVYAWDGHNLVVAEAERPFPKPPGPMHRVRLSDGQEFVGASEHRILLSDGSWIQLSHLRPGDSVFHPQTNSDTDQTSPSSGVPHSTETASDSQVGYQNGSRLYDELLHVALNICPDVSPSPDDAPRHIYVYDSNRRSMSTCASRLWRCMSGALDNELSHSRFELPISLLSIRDGLPQHAAPSVDTLSRVSCRPCKSTLRLRGGLVQEQVYQQPIAEFSHHPQCSGEFPLRSNQSCHGVAYVESIDSAGI